MANFLQTLKELLNKAGLSETNEAVAQLLQSEKIQALQDVEIDNAISNILQQKLITLEGAKAHQEVSAHFKKSYFGAIDSKLKATLQEIGLSEEVINEIDKAGNTETRLQMAIQKAIETKGKQTNSQEIETLRNTLQSLKDASKSEKEKLLSEIQNWQARFEETHKEYAIKDSLSKYKFIDNIAPEHVNLIIKNEIQNELQKRKAILKYSEGKFALKSAENPELDYFDNEKGKTLQYDDILNTVIANTKLQKVAESDPKDKSSFKDAPSGGTITSSKADFLNRVAQ